MALGSVERGGERKFQPKNEREKGLGRWIPMSAVILAQGQSVRPLVAGACELALWAVALGVLRVLNFNVFYSSRVITSYFLYDTWLFFG